MDQARNGSRAYLQGQTQSLSLGAAEQTNNTDAITGPELTRTRQADAGGGGGGRNGPSVARAAPGEPCVLTRCQVQRGHTEHRQQSGPGLSCQSAQAVLTPHPAHCLRRSCRAPGPALDLVPVMLAADQPSATGGCCQAVPSLRERHTLPETALNDSGRGPGLRPCPTEGQGWSPKLPWKNDSPQAGTPFWH